MLKKLICIALFMLGITNVSAENIKIINFDDLPNGFYDIPTGYAGLHWSNVSIASSGTPPWGHDGNGFSATSQPNAAYIYEYGGFSSSFEFILKSMTLNYWGAHDRYENAICENEGICDTIDPTIYISGLNGNELLYKSIFETGTNKNNIEFNEWILPITSIRISYADPLHGFVTFDNIQIISTVPLPPTSLLLGSGLLAIFGLNRKKHRA